MIITLKKFENGKCVWVDSHKVLGWYEFMGSEYVITTAKPGSGALVEVMEVVPRTSIRFNDGLTGGNYEKNEILKGDFFIGVRCEETPVIKYIKRIYLKYGEDFFARRKVYGRYIMGKKLGSDYPFEDEGILVPSTPRSSDGKSGLLDYEIMCLPMVDAIILDEESFKLSRREEVLSGPKHTKVMHRILKKNNVSN